MKSLLLAILLLPPFASGAEDSFPPLNGHAPKSLDELWAGYNPRKEPLDIEIGHEWEEDGVVCRVVRYRVGVFKGKKAMVLAVYGFPKGGSRLPGLVQVHGGGQSANRNVVITNAKLGYASISVNWGGNPINVPEYHGPNTDWGNVDATQHGHNDHYRGVSPDAKTLDSIPSARNNNWFLLTVAARRALTFLEQQPEVDGARLGIYGHSMGANITLYTAGIDHRVKAAVPSSGAGTGDRSDNNQSEFFNNGAYAERIACPILFLNPANDFHGSIEGIEATVARLETREYRYSRVAHLNHRDTPEHLVCNPLWFDQHLKGTFRFPLTPQSKLTLKTPHGVPVFTVVPDSSRPVAGVEIYYTQQGPNRQMNFASWHYAKAKRIGDSWTAELPVISLEQPLEVYGNVNYPLDHAITGAGYYYALYTAREFSIATKLSAVSPATLSEAGVKVTDKPSLLIEAFGDDWRKNWYTYDPDGGWPYRTNKFLDTKWQAPTGVKLAMEVRSAQPNRLLVELDTYWTEVPLKGGGAWESVRLSPSDFHDADGGKLAAWRPFVELVLGDQDRIRDKAKSTPAGKEWAGPKPEFRDLRWVPSTASQP